MPKATPQDQQKIEQKQRAVQEELNRQGALEELALYTLNQFAYRYFDSPEPAEVIQTNGPFIFSVRALETGIKEAIKISNPKLREGLKQLVQAFPPKEVTVARLLLIEVSDRERGEVTVRSRVSFDHPDHRCSERCIEKKAQYQFGEFIELRNHLARLLEDVSELF